MTKKVCKLWAISAFSLMHRSWVFILVSLLLFCIRCTDSEDPALAALFTFEIEPLLHDKCFSCHGHDQTALEGDLDLTSRQNMLRGGQSGQAAIIPGDPEASPLLDAVIPAGKERVKLLYRCKGRWLRPGPKDPTGAKIYGRFYP